MSREAFMPDGGLPPQAAKELYKLTRVELNTYIAVCALYRYPTPVMATPSDIKAMTRDRLAEIRDALISLQEVRRQNVGGRVILTRPRFITQADLDTYRPEVGFPVVPLEGTVMQ